MVQLVKFRHSVTERFGGTVRLQTLEIGRDLSADGSSQPTRKDHQLEADIGQLIGT